MNNFSENISFEKKIIIWVFRVAACVPLVFYPESMFAYTLPKEVILGILCLIPVIAVPGIFRIKKLAGPPLYMLLFIIFSILSIGSCLNIYRFFYKIWFLLVVYLSALGVSRVLSAEEYIKKIVPYHLWVCIVVAVHGLLQFHEILPGEIFRKFPSLFGNHNVAAYYFAILIPLFFKDFLKKSLVQKTAVVSGWLIMCWFCMVSNSRAVAAVILLQIIACMFSFMKKKYIIAAIVMISVLGCIVLIFSDRARSVLNDPFRLWCFKSTINMIHDFPVFGVGAGNFEYYYPLYRSLKEVEYIELNSYVAMPHNDYLHILAENGITGIILFLLAIIQGIRGKKREIQLAILSACIIMLTGWIYILMTHMVLLFTLLFLPQKKEENYKHDLRIKIAGIAALLAVVWYGYATIAADHWYYLAEDANIFRRYDEAAEYISKSVNSMPSHYEYWFCAGNVYRNLREYNLAEKCYLTAGYLHPNFLFIWQNLGYVQSVTGQFDKAENNYLKSLEILPILDSPYYNLSVLYEKQHKLKKALDMMKKIKMGTLRDSQKRDFYSNRIRMLEKRLEVH